MRTTKPNRWPLRISTVLFVFGTAHYVLRDSFHADESIVQPIIEIPSVVVATCLSFGALIYYPVRLALRLPYLLLLGMLLLAVAFSLRSWDPLLSVTRGILLVMISASTVALLQTYGLRPLVRAVLNAYIFLIVVGLIVGLLFPEQFPLMLHDPGQEEVRVRLHLFMIHPVMLADNCAICLLASVLFRGRWIRLCRLIFVTCLLLTVTRTSIILGLPLYVIAEIVFATGLRRGLRPANAIGLLAVVPGIVAIGLLFAYSDWGWVDEISSSVMHVMDATENDVTLNGRTPLWSMLLADLSSDNVYGYGVGGDRYYLRTINPWFVHAHNSILETIYTAGYLGAGLIIVALIGALTSCIKLWKFRDARVLLVTLCYVIAAGMMEPSWYATSSLMVLSVVCSGPWTLRGRRVAMIAPLRVTGAWHSSYK